MDAKNVGQKIREAQDVVTEHPAEEKAEMNFRDAPTDARLEKNRKRLDLIKVFLALSALFAVIPLFLLWTLGSLWVEHEKTDKTEDYAAFMSEPDTRNPFAPHGKNEWIFPKQLPEEAEVKSFYYEYLNNWNPNYVVYLDLTMEREVYEKERRRVEKCGIPLRESQYMVNGATGFYYPLLSASGRNKGILYALTDEAQYRIMYVEISYYGYYSDIDYTKAIPPDVLPAGFDAGKGNPTQRAFRVMRNFINGNAHFPGPYGQE